MMDRLSGRAALAVAAAALLVVVLVGWFGFVAPQRAKAQELEAETQRTQFQLDTTLALIRGDARQESTRELARLRRAIPDDVSMSVILRELSRASAESRIRIVAITPQPPAPSGAAQAIPISLNVEGRYARLREFMRQLRTRTVLEGETVQTNGRLFSIASIQFSGGTDTGGLIQATVDMSAYSFGGGASAPGGTVPPTAEASAEVAGG